ncbi:MAG: DedA family protein [Armatimonadota bacterium]
MDINSLLKMAPDVLSQVIESGRPYIIKYGLLAIALGLFGETFFFTGIIVPGYGILVAAGFLIAAGQLPFIPVILLAWVCAILGDVCSYYLGYWWGSVLLRRHSAFVERMRLSLEKEGPTLLLWYHYAPTLRALLPCTAGSSHYQMRRWLVFDSLGVFIWVIVVLAIGFCAHGAMFSHGNVIALFINALATLLMIIITWRIYRNYAHSRKADAPDVGTVVTDNSTAGK